MGPPDEERHRATYADVEAAPPHLVAEIVNGELRTTRRPPPRHALATSRLFARLYGPFDRGEGGPGGWLVFREPEIHLGAGPDVLVPDLVGFRRARVPELPEAYFELAPDWICEVLNPSTNTLDRAEKMPIYAREGVRHAWLIDPLVKTLEVYVLNAEQVWMLTGVYQGEARVRAAPFDEIELDLGQLWAKIARA